MSSLNKIRDLPEDVVDLIFKFSTIRCHVCYKRLRYHNIKNFFCYPENQISNTNTHYYCSWICFNYT